MNAAQAREWVEHAPTAETLQAAELLGWTFDTGGDNPDLVSTNGGPWFLCAECAGKLLARGCAFSHRETTPVWEDRNPALAIPCAVCKKK